MNEGLLLADGVVQPFDLRFAADDLHVMAFFAGHAEYEAVEAMIRRLAGGGCHVRAILTRHDQTQVDHVNDAATLRAARSLRRETCLREISVAEESSSAGHRVVVRFASVRDEQVELDVISAGRLDGARGGLTDPGRHSLQSSLPIMWRGKSALAAPASRVAIDGRAWPIPERLRIGGRIVAVEGYLSQPHHMAALRAGSSSYEVVERPTRAEPGQRWVQRSAAGERVYRIASVDASGAVEIVASPGAPEIVTGRLVDGRFRLRQVRVADANAAGSQACLAFDGAGAFSIGVGAAHGLVTGAVATSQTDANVCAIRLEPNQPGWARARAIDVRIASRGAAVSITTSIGGAAATPCDDAHTAALHISAQVDS